MADDDPPDHSSSPEDGNPHAPVEEPKPLEHQSSRELPYAQVLPVHPARPIELDYGRPAARSPSSAGRTVSKFIFGMTLPVAVGMLSIDSRLRGAAATVFLFSLMGVPLVMLGFRQTRMIGAGWFTTMALFVLAIAIICGGLK
jgi:hypothetical protein